MKKNFLVVIAMKYLIVLTAMVAFARAKAKIIFSKFGFEKIYKTQRNLPKRIINEEKSVKEKRSSKYFLEAIKSGGIWLSYQKSQFII